MLLIESCLILAAVVLALVCPGLGSSWLEKIESISSRLAQHRLVSVFVVGVTALSYWIPEALLGGFTLTSTSELPMAY